jgi:hypothetical protein
MISVDFKLHVPMSQANAWALSLTLCKSPVSQKQTSASGLGGARRKEITFSFGDRDLGFPAWPSTAYVAKDAPILLPLPRIQGFQI